MLRLRLYIAGHTPRSVAALANLRKICDEHAKENCEIEVVDLMLDPARAEDDHIIAVPALVKISPPPAHTIIGDLSDVSRVALILGL